MKISARNRLISNMDPKEVESSTKAIVNHLNRKSKLKVIGSPRINKVRSTIKTAWQIDSRVFGPLANLVFGMLVIETEEGSVDYMLESNVYIILTEEESGDDISVFLDRFAYDVHNDDLVRIW